MYGKIFASTFTGSMFGAGPETFAVWSYVIANTVAGVVELNPEYLGHVIGMPPGKIEAVIEKLCSPDPRSRNKDHDGRRLIREGQFQYVVPSHETYREIRTEDSRREYQRRWVKEKRGKEKREVTDPVDIDSSRHDLDTSTPAYASESEISDPDQTRSTTGAKSAWTPHEWWTKFGAAWREHYNTMAGPGGGDGAARATGALGEELGRMNAGARAVAERRAPGMFREFLADASPGMVKARHPWAWFVTRFGGLLVPTKEPAQARPQSISLVNELPDLPKWEPRPPTAPRPRRSPAVATSEGGPQPADVQATGSATNAR